MGLKKRVDSFMALASVEERQALEDSRDSFIKVQEQALSAGRQGSDDAGDKKSSAKKARDVWYAATEVTYEYVQMLDVMVGQAPEYVGLAYGAIKIILVAQINHEEVKQKVKSHLEQVQMKFKMIDHLTTYMPTSQLITLVAQAYGLFYRFLAKAVKYYTQSRLSR